MAGGGNENGDTHGDRHDGDDLVMLAFTGVQAFISESRRTGDMHAASRVVAELVRAAANEFPPLNIVYPHPAAQYPPNRVVAFAPAGQGEVMASRARDAVVGRWRLWHADLFGEQALADESPGFPSVQWVCIRPGGSYEQRWGVAGDVLRARRRVRDFEQREWAQRRLCNLSAQWPSVDPPKRTAKYDEDTLSSANWLKRRWRSLADGEASPRFPSTASIASAPMLRTVLGRLVDPAVRAGQRHTDWCDHGRWCRIQDLIGNRVGSG